MILSGFLRRCRHVALPAAAVLAAVAGFFHRAAFTDQIFFSRDIQRVYYPLRQYWAERVLHGGFPEWFPYDGLGQPFIGMVISGAFHPSNLLYLFLPLGTALKVNILACYPIPFFGVYFFARRWSLSPVASALGAVLFTFNGFMISITNNLLYLMAAATIPWALWAADRFFDRPTAARALTGASLLTLILLAGDAQGFALCIPAIALLVVMRHRHRQAWAEAKAFAALISLAVLLSAVQIVPALKALPETVSSLRRPDVALLWSTHPLRLLELIWGPIFGGEPASATSMAIDIDLLKTGATTLWVESMHFGLPGAVLALSAWLFHRSDWRTWCLVAYAGGLLLLALGKFVGVYGWLFQALPLWRTFRYPEKILPHMLLVLAIAAAVGLEEALRNPRSRARLTGLLAIFGGATLLVFAAELRGEVLSQGLFTPLWHGSPPPEALSRLHRALLSATAQSLVAATGLAALLLVVARRPYWALAMPALCFAELAIANEGMYELTFPTLLQTPTAFVSAIEKRESQAGGGKPRVVSAIQAHHVPLVSGLSIPDGYAASMASALLPDIPALWRIESADGYLPAESKRVYRLTKQPLIWYLRFDADFGTRYTVLPEEVFEQINGRKDLVVMRHPAFHLLLLENPAAAPRATLRRARCVRSEDEAFQMVISRNFDSAREAVVECGNELRSATYTPAPSDRVEIDNYAPERIEITATNNSPALLMLNDAMFQGWTANVDDRLSEIIPANYAVRGIELERGVHKIVLRYRTPGLMLGAWISLFGLLAALTPIFLPRFWAVRSQKTSLLPVAEMARVEIPRSFDTVTPTHSGGANIARYEPGNSATLVPKGER